MPTGWGIIRKADNSDGDLVVGVDYWSEREMNVTRNALKALGSLRSTQYFAMNRDAEVFANATEVLMPGHGFPVTIDWSQIQPAGIATYSAIVSVMVKTANAATDITVYIKRITGTPANVLTFGPSTSTTWTTLATQAFPATETGTQQYEAYVYGNNGTHPIRGMAKVDFYAP